MNIYLVIIATIFVVTQVIRVIQSWTFLRRASKCDEDSDKVLDILLKLAKAIDTCEDIVNNIEIKNDDMELLFEVIDKKTGKEPDLKQIALNEEWAKDLVYSDMEGFYLGQDGNLVLADECGNFVGCPEGRFVVKLFLRGRVPIGL